MTFPHPETHLLELLDSDLDFHDQDSLYASHNFHAFPAKFPPQLPRLFIQSLTGPGDVVLDPMSGSGTTILEAVLAGRQAIGCDIDPLAIKIIQGKTTPLDPELVSRTGKEILANASDAVHHGRELLQSYIQESWDDASRRFIDEWFDKDTQVELAALIRAINQIDDEAVQNFFQLAFSAIIITKSGGVSLALDLAHTRPHRPKIIMRKGEVLEGHDLAAKSDGSLRHLTKILRSPLEEFEKRYKNNIKGLLSLHPDLGQSRMLFGNAQQLPLPSNSVDLIVTSPPYASNAIDYMRAHKFSLVWLGYPIADLGNKRKEYIGGENLKDFPFIKLPSFPTSVVVDITGLDSKKGQTLHRYYTEMTYVLREMYRVLRPGKVAIVVVGSSVMRGQDTQTQTCLAEIGRAIGFVVPKIGTRNLDRDRRMLPAGFRVNYASQIQQRMHEEYVIGFYKP